MEYYKIQKTVNEYWFKPDYVNFERVNPDGLKIPDERLSELKKQFTRKFKYDLVVYKDNNQSFGFLSVGRFNDTDLEYPLIKEFDPDTIDSFTIKSLHPTRFGGHLEVMMLLKSGESEVFFHPGITNINYETWDWCVDRYIIAPMEKISQLTGIRISEITKDYDC
jgi:hypothetical protein